MLLRTLIPSYNFTTADLIVEFGNLYADLRSKYTRRTSSL